jgi:dihydrofolate reductase
MNIQYIIIAAVSLNGVMGRNGKLPWFLPGDLQHFKKMTEGHPIVMGRKTCEGFKRPLPGRDNLVLSKSQSHREGFQFFTSLDSIESWCQKNNKNKVFIIGGAEIYRLYLPKAFQMLISRVDANVEGDTYFPEGEKSEWILTPALNMGDARDEFPWHLEMWKRN